MNLQVFVPASFVPQEWVRAGDLAGVAPGSAIVGRRVAHSVMFEVAFEGNIYGASNMIRFADRCQVAASRLDTGYPTVARRMVGPASLVDVGEWTGGRVILNGNGGWLVRWLASEPGALLDPSELVL